MLLKDQTVYEMDLDEEPFLNDMVDFIMKDYETKNYFTYPIPKRITSFKLWMLRIRKLLKRFMGFLDDNLFYPLGQQGTHEYIKISVVVVFFVISFAWVWVLSGFMMS